MSRDDQVLDVIADEFEATWRGGARPEIADFLVRVEDQLRQRLAQLLIPVDLEYRLQAGEQVAAVDYAGLGAGYALIAGEAIEASHVGKGGLQPTLGWAGRTPAEPVTDQFSLTDSKPRFAQEPQKGVSGVRAIGPYRLMEQVGEGGMGTVWVAEQFEPVRRRVALKLIRVDRGDSSDFIRRFEAERQAIALMDHPNIARLFDAGTTDRGEPFFVMELVRGIPLTDYCDQHRLAIPQRLELFAAICNAVQHAHQKGIIHRDLKPSNILVEEVNGKATPKVIDFGLAKATGGVQLTDATLDTRFGAVLGTPLYMAPEQASGNSLDIDTRADVYALGVILYELLTGTTPISRESLKNAALDELVRIIREEEPPTPSSRISSSDNAPSVAANRQTEPARLGRLVRGELDWIVLKALSKERDRRYESPSGLASDIERFLNHEPVLAGPPSTVYRLKKFVRRNRVQVAAASLVLLALVSGVIGTSVGLFEAEHQREIAENELKGKKAALELAESRREEAERNLAYARKGNDVLASVFQNLDPYQDYQTMADLRSALGNNLETALLELDKAELPDGGAAVALKYQIANSMMGLGEAAKAVEILAGCKAEAIQENSPSIKLISKDYGLALFQAGRYELAKIELDDSLSGSSDWPEEMKLDRLEATSVLSEVERVLGNQSRSLELAQSVVRELEPLVERSDRRMIRANSRLASSLRTNGRLTDADRLFSETLNDMQESVPRSHPLRLSLLNNRAIVLRALRRNQESIEIYREVLELTRTSLGVDHPSALSALGNLGSALFGARQLDEATTVLEEAVARSKQKLGADNPECLNRMASLSGCYWATRRFDLSIPLMEEVADALSGKLGPEHSESVHARANLANHLRDAGRLEEAVAIYKDADRRGVSLNDPLFISRNWLMAVSRNGDRDETLRLAKEILDACERGLPENGMPLTSQLFIVATALFDVDEYRQAETVFRRLLKIYESMPVPEWMKGDVLVGIGLCQAKTDAFGDAILELEKGWKEIVESERPMAEPQRRDRLLQASRALSACYEKTGQEQLARKWQEEAAALNSESDK